MDYCILSSFCVNGSEKIDEMIVLFVFGLGLIFNLSLSTHTFQKGNR